MAVDGGPFNNFRADGVAGGGTLVGTDGTEVDLELLEDAMESQMLDAQPINLSTGDVADEETRVGTIEVPMLVGYTIVVHNLSGDYDDLGNLAERNGQTASFERKMMRHGGQIEG